jgi:hypothetical protein
MTPDQVVAALQQYDTEMASMLGRFRNTSDGLHIDQEDNTHLHQLVVELIDLLQDHVPDSAAHIRMIGNAYNEGNRNFYGTSSYASVEQVRSLVSALVTRIQRNPALFSPVPQQVGLEKDLNKRLADLDNLLVRFHVVVNQLRRRHDGRATLDVNDEYDVQDLLHALLRLHFDDVRPEEHTPSYGGGSARTDFLLPEVQTVIEVKKTRSSLTAKALGEQLIIDIARYKMHPHCRRLICFVYDPEARIPNPAGIENDLNAEGHGIDVRVSILPRPA